MKRSAHDVTATASMSCMTETRCTLLYITHSVCTALQTYIFGITACVTWDLERTQTLRLLGEIITLVL